MPHRNKHQHGGSKSNAEHGSQGRQNLGKDEKQASLQMSTEFPSYNALAEGGPAGDPWRTSEHRADTGRMNRSTHQAGGTSAKRSPDADEGFARGESTGQIRAEFESEQPARGESTNGDGSSHALWDEALQQQTSRGESTGSLAGDDELTLSGFATTARGESVGRGDRSEVNEAPRRGESTGQDSSEPESR